MRRTLGSGAIWATCALATLASPASCLSLDDSSENDSTDGGGKGGGAGIAADSGFPSNGSAGAPSDAGLFDADDYDARLQAAVELAHESFDQDPGWLAENNHVHDDCRDVHQNFGYSNTGYANGHAGEMGGTLVRSVTPAYYGMAHPEKDLFAGRLAFDADVSFRGGGGGAYLGYFSSKHQGFRPAGFTGIRLDAAGNEANLEVSITTSDYRSAGSFLGLSIPNDGKGHRVTFEWLPDENNGKGHFNASVDDVTKSFDVTDDVGHATSIIDRFGLMNVQAPGANGFEVYVDDVGLNVINTTVKFDSNPGWDGHGNGDSFTDCRQRLQHDYGYSADTNFAGGAAKGEMGGLIWRMNADDPTSYYATPVGPLSPDDYLFFSGKIGFVRGAVDSGIAFGFFDSKLSFGTEPARSFFGLAIEGPSRVGHYMSAFVTDANANKYRPTDGAPVLVPDGSTLPFTFAYDPDAGDHGTIQLTLGSENYDVPLPAEQRAGGQSFDRFGIMPWRPDGESVDIYFDDLTYTLKRH
jgi:hypothetical protein